MRTSVIKAFAIKILVNIGMPLLLITSAYAHGPIPVDIPDVGISKYPPIEQDIQAMSQYGNAAQQAGQRLVERGVSALGHIHQALENPQSFPQQMQLITVLGEIGDSDSVNLIIDIAEHSNSQYVYQNALLALPKFEQQDGTIEFVNKQLANEKQHPLIQRSALTYYSQQPHPDAHQWVTKYNQPNTSPEVRYAALYLGGMLGDESVKQDIIDLLQNKQKNAREYYLLLGLAEITQLDEFLQLLEQLDLDSSNKEKAKKYAEFRKSPADKQAALAEELLAKGDSTLKRAAANYLVKTKNANALAKYWKQENGLVRGSVKRAGYNIHITDKDAIFEKREDYSKNKSTLYLWILVIVVSIALGIFIYRRKPQAPAST
ncbi:MAG: hypothetical protein QM500_00430 [Methylococcales bacterium]